MMRPSRAAAALRATEARNEPAEALRVALHALELTARVLRDRLEAGDPIDARDRERLEALPFLARRARALGRRLGG